MQKYKNLITARIIADSISKNHRLTTFELTYPRFILAEVNTHRMLSKNSASSRAIPIKQVNELIQRAPAGFVEFGKNQPGMQAKELLNSEQALEADATWLEALEAAVKYSERLSALGVHKQIVNRVTEPWAVMKTVMTGTHWGNMLYLRNHQDAQPEFRYLAQQIEGELQRSTPQELSSGEWHTPYVESRRDAHGALTYWVSETEVSQEVALKVSASCCAQVSYRKNDTTLEKAEKIFDQLILSKPAHSSPVEHQATPMDESYYEIWYYDPRLAAWRGVTHQDAHGELWSGNLCGWVQYRKLIEATPTEF